MKPNAYDIKRNIGVVFQDVAVFEELTVYENIDYFCGLYVQDKKIRKQYIKDAIDLVGLDNYKTFYPKQLSGGLLRRLNIACGIAHKPKLIFFDEPTVAVDPQSRQNILDGIKELPGSRYTLILGSQRVSFPFWGVSFWQKALFHMEYFGEEGSFSLFRPASYKHWRWQEL